MALKLLCTLGIHKMQTRQFGACQVRHCTRFCGRLPEYLHEGRWIPFVIPREKHFPTVTPERMARP